MLWIDLWWNLKLRAVVSSLKLKRDLNVTVVVEPKRLMRKQKLNGITHKNNCKYLRKISRNAFAKVLFHYFSHLTPLPKFSLLVTPFFITFLESQHFWPIFLQGVSFRACFFFSSLTRNFLNTYSAIRNNSYNFSMATTWSVGNFCLQESSPLALGNMTPARSMGGWRKAVVFTLQAFPSAIPPFSSGVLSCLFFILLSFLDESNSLNVLT